MTEFRDQKISEEVAQQAADFVVQVYSGNMSSKDESALMNWLEADAGHRAEYEQMLDIWAEAGDMDMDVPALRATSTTRVADSWSQRWAIAAGLAIVAIGASLFAVFETDIFGSSGPSVYATAVGEQWTLTLDDGSTVTLNTDSQLVVDYSDSYRNLRLDKGEVFFEVSKDRERPFTVEAGVLSVTALGTQFNIYRETDDMTVAVVEGIVAVHDKLPADIAADVISGQAVPTGLATTDIEGLYRLEAGSVGAFDGGSEGMTAIETPNIEDHYSWRDGTVRFEDETLARLIREFNRYSPQKISIVDDRIAELRIGGVFRLDNVRGTLAGLEATHPVRVVERNDQYLVLATDY